MHSGSINIKIKKITPDLIATDRSYNGYIDMILYEEQPLAARTNYHHGNDNDGYDDEDDSRMAINRISTNSACACAASFRRRAASSASNI